MMQIDPTLRALADPTRLRIMRLLAAMELAVGEIAAVLGQSQPRVSRHIRILCDAGLAARRKEGSWVFLRSAIAPEDAARPLGAATARLLAVAEDSDAGFATTCTADRAALAAIRAAREEAAAAYFARHAAEWDRIRVLHSAEGAVEAALLAVLAAGGSGAGAAPLGGLLDIGTGTGRIAELLAPYARQVTGLDKSPEMLRIARARLQHLPGGADLMLGDFAALPAADGAFDTTVFHQVLHFAQAPEIALAEAARVTRAGGRIAIVDFAAHDREELRSLHAHARLGFGEAQMAALLAGAGFAETASHAVPGTGPDQPLTVKIWIARRIGTPAAAAPATEIASQPRSARETQP